MTVTKKQTNKQTNKKNSDHLEFQPGTLALLAPRSTNWGNVLDREEWSIFISIDLQF